MRCLLGNTEVRTIYQNFELLNLHTNAPDRSHLLYTHYLQNQKFLPPHETNYFEHTCSNLVPPEPSKTEGKGTFNIFPLSLTSDEMDHSSSSSLGKKTNEIISSYFNALNFIILIIGVVSTSPLKLEIEFEPVPTNNWFMFWTFSYINKINFSGSKTRQDVNFDYLR
jgi:hypothetical protein